MTATRSDLAIASDFFAMLERHGACILQREDGDTHKFELIPHLFHDNDTSTLVFSFKGDLYHRIDGYAGGRHGLFYLSKVHQRGWQSR
jgi:hypothetical protein